jgi:hypothetical protein
LQQFWVAVQPGTHAAPPVVPPLVEPPLVVPPPVVLPPVVDVFTWQTLLVPQVNPAQQSRLPERSGFPQGPVPSMAQQHPPSGSVPMPEPQPPPVVVPELVLEPPEVEPDVEPPEVTPPVVPALLVEPPVDPLLAAADVVELEEPAVDVAAPVEPAPPVELATPPDIPAEEEVLVPPLEFEQAQKTRPMKHRRIFEGDFMSFSSTERGRFRLEPHPTGILTRMRGLANPGSDSAGPGGNTLDGRDGIQWGPLTLPSPLQGRGEHPSAPEERTSELVAPPPSILPTLRAVEGEAHPRPRPFGRDRELRRSGSRASSTSA